MFSLRATFISFEFFITKSAVANENIDNVVLIFMHINKFCLLHCLLADRRSAIAHFALLFSQYKHLLAEVALRFSHLKSYFA